MADYSESSMPLRQITGIQFGVLGADEIKKMSVTTGGGDGVEGLRYPEEMDFDKRCFKEGGSSDPRHGPIDRATRCKTCSGNMTSCPGHFGHIELVKPIFHVGWFTLTGKILRCVCYQCSRLLIERNDKQLLAVLARSKHSSRKRFDAVYDLCKAKNCCAKKEEEKDQSIPTDEGEHQNVKDEDERTGCGFHQPKYRRQGPVNLTAEWKKDKMADDSQEPKINLTAEKVLEIFRRISDEDMRILGMNPEQSRPEWLITTVIPAAPMTVRPSVQMGSGMRAADDITYSALKKFFCFVGAEIWSFFVVFCIFCIFLYFFCFCFVFFVFFNQTPTPIYERAVYLPRSHQMQRKLAKSHFFRSRAAHDCRRSGATPVSLCNHHRQHSTRNA